MPYVKKSEYVNLKSKAAHYHELAKSCDRNYADVVTLRGQLKLFESRLEHSEELRDQSFKGYAAQTALYEMRLKNEELHYEFVIKALRDAQWSGARWKRYYEAAVKTFKIQEYVEMPGCFNPMESIEYIAKRQEEETKNGSNRHAC